MPDQLPWYAATPTSAVDRRRELQRELIVVNTRKGLAAARARGRNGGRRPRLNADQVALAQRLYDAGEHTVQQIADIFSVPRTTVYGHLDNAT